MTQALAIVPQSNAEIYRASTDAAGLCRDIVLKTAQQIQGRKYVKVEGWQAIAIAHGCIASADDVERVNEEGTQGFRATGTIRRMSDGVEIARAEGFVGDDESMWFKRPVYARRAMAQTRAISRAARSAFAHVVVLIDSNLSTTPAEEMPQDGEEAHREPSREPPRNVTPLRQVSPGKTLTQLADDFEAALRACRSQADLTKLDHEVGSTLSDRLAAEDPARDRIVAALYLDTQARLAAAEPSPFDDERRA